MALDIVRVKLEKSGELDSVHATEITTADEANNILRELIADSDREMLALLTVDVKKRPINLSVVSMGTVSGSLVHPREIFKAAVLSNASGIFLAHNHPGGSLVPSQDDLQVTQRIYEAGELMGIPLLDHLIITDRGYTSVRSQYGDLRRINGNLTAENVREGASGKTQQAKVKELTEQLEQGIEKLFQSDQYKIYLDTMSKFHNYSVNNTLLIYMQCPQASLVAGYAKWRDEFHRYPRKGEHGIRIFAPSPYKKKIETETLDEKGNRVTEEQEVLAMGFRTAVVFDISQTDGEPLPQLGVEELDGEVKNYAEIYQALEKLSPFPIVMEDIQNGAKGYCDMADRKIAIQQDMSQLQTIKTLIHEVAHAKMHDYYHQTENRKEIKSRANKEVEAESVAYVVCKHFGLDTSEYSFAYVAGWEGQDRNLLKDSLKVIQEAANEIISTVDRVIEPVSHEKNKERIKSSEMER